MCICILGDESGQGGRGIGWENAEFKMKINILQLLQREGETI